MNKMCFEHKKRTKTKIFVSFYLLGVALLHHHLLLFSGQLLLADLLLALLGLLGNSLFTLGQDHLDVARVRHERVDSTVSSVGSSAVLGRLVDGDVLDVETVNIPM